MIFEVDSQRDIVIDEPEFFVAISMNKFEGTGVDFPLCVTRVT